MYGKIIKRGFLSTFTSKWPLRRKVEYLFSGLCQLWNECSYWAFLRKAYIQRTIRNSILNKNPSKQESQTDCGLRNLLIRIFQVHKAQNICNSFYGVCWTNKNVKCTKCKIHLTAYINSVLKAIKLDFKLEEFMPLAYMSELCLHLSV